MSQYSAQIIGAGLATISILGTGAGIGTIFAALINAQAINPAQSKATFKHAVLGFALTEAIALFGLMIVFLLLYAI